MAGRPVVQLPLLVTDRPARPWPLQDGSGGKEAAFKKLHLRCFVRPSVGWFELLKNFFSYNLPSPVSV